MTEERVKSFQFRQHLARMIEAAETRPVIVTKRGERSVVLVSHEEYQRVKRFMYMNQTTAIDPL